jgi:hypothetical protein
LSARYAVYYAPGRDSALWRAGEGWLRQPGLATLTVAARRYGFHATLRAPMRLAGTLEQMRDAVLDFAATHPPVPLTGLAPRLVGGFLALTTAPQPAALTAFAAALVEATEPCRAPPTAAETARRLAAPLTPRQAELVARFGYPYVLDQFQFHLTLTDRLPEPERPALLARAADWFAPALAEPVALDRLVLYEEPAPGAPFRRLDPDCMLKGA